MIRTVGIDGDDTLWHNENLFADTEARYKELLSHHATAEQIGARLYETEMRNLGIFGYGVKSFMLSMIETAIEITEQRIGAADIQQIIQLGREMMAEPVDLLDGVRETVEELAEHYDLLLITKGDLFHQESKVARSGLADHFRAVEIVSEKDPATYRAVLDRHVVDPGAFVMIGNSVRSDITPVVEIGGRGLHIPYHVTWAHEDTQLATHHHEGFWELASIRDAPTKLSELGRA